MRTHFILPVLIISSGLALNPSSHAATVSKARLDQLYNTYEFLHRHPELSYHENHTAAYLAKRLRNKTYNQRR